MGFKMATGEQEAMVTALIFQGLEQRRRRGDVNTSLCQLTDICLRGHLDGESATRTSTLSIS